MGEEFTMEEFIDFMNRQEGEFVIHVDLSGEEESHGTDR